MPAIPREKSLDSTLALMADPYRFISGRCRKHNSDVFEARLLFQKTLCMTGEEAARLFYDPARFKREGAMPAAVQKTLLGEGGVQSLDGDAHANRKRMFMALMTQERIDALVRLTAAELQACARRWAAMPEVVLYRELHPALTRAVCDWAGVPLQPEETGQRTRDIVALFDAAGSAGLRHLGSRYARKRCDRWMAGIMSAIRAARYVPPEDSAAHVIAWHRDTRGALLPERIAAVELLNVVRPTVAVSVYMVFVVHALHLHPELRERCGEEGYAELFVREVRRYYPFFPAVAARVIKDFHWNGHLFPGGRRVLLDIYGTNHDPRSWERPEIFDPERFRKWDGNPYDFIPQGGGDHYAGHRCPGEWIAIALMKLAVEFFTRGIAFEVPEQDLSIDFGRLPALPRSGLVIRAVRQADPLRPTAVARGPAAA